eukprot:6081862-Amphidinium_carterae.1
MVNSRLKQSKFMSLIQAATTNKRSVYSENGYGSRPQQQPSPGESYHQLLCILFKDLCMFEAALGSGTLFVGRPNL